MGNYMEKVLVAGTNTRAVVCSLKKLGYQVYSADYFGSMDLRSCADKFESVLDQKPLKSCGKFSERFKTSVIEKMALEMVDDVDGIICCVGVSPARFPSNKIIGNVDLEVVEDKYSLIKNIEGYFNVPETHLVTDRDDAKDIATSSPDKKFILKPRYGAGGYGVRMFDFSNHLEDKEYSTNINQANINQVIENDDWILQEFIQGENISASVLATKSDATTILTSSQIIGDEVLGQREPFGYCGNIVPYTEDTNTGNTYTEDMEISEIAQKVVTHLSLIGSNGVDFILRNGELYVIEVNPRLQGTFECAEMALDINMAEAHHEAFQGHLMKIPNPSKFAVKMVIHAHQRSHVGNLDLEGVHDLPNRGVIIEKGEPIATVLTSNSVKEDAIYSARKQVQMVYNQLG
jgi:uncharacterized protein